MKYEWESSYIYILRCPVTHEVRYVGRTTLPTVRRSIHKSGHGNTPIEQWKQSLRKLGLTADFEIVEVINGDDSWTRQIESKIREAWWIRHFQAKGANLLNRIVLTTKTVAKLQAIIVTN